MHHDKKQLKSRSFMYKERQKGVVSKRGEVLLNLVNIGN